MLTAGGRGLWPGRDGILAELEGSTTDDTPEISALCRKIII